MKKIFLLCFSICLIQYANTQTIIYSEDFEGTSINWTLNSTANGGMGIDASSNQWVINNVYNGGIYYFLGVIPINVPSTNTQPVAITNSPTSKYMHINYGLSQIDNTNYVDGSSISMAGGIAGINFSCMNYDISTTGYSNVSFNFYWICDGAVGKVYYSTNSGTTWSPIGNDCAGSATWTLTTITNNVFDNQSTLRFGFVFDNTVAGTGNDPSFAIDQLSVTNSGSGNTNNTVATDNLSDDSFCACSPVNVPYTATGTFANGNIFTAELSDATGNFSSPITIGTLTSTALSGTINCIIPCNSIAGNAYRIRVISSNPAIIGIDNGVNITINTNETPAVTISASPSGTICTGTSVTFTLTSTNGGTNPIYQWQKNNMNVAIGNTYTSSLLENGDEINLIMISNASCISTTEATSNTIIMNVVDVLTPSVSITSNPSGSVCIGSPISFETIPINGGNSPQYLWQVNGITAGTDSVFSSNSLAENAIVTVQMTSSFACATSSPVISNEIIVHHIPKPTLSINPQNSTITSGDENVTLTVNGADSYVWLNDNSNGNSITVSPNQSQNYCVIGEKNGCTDTICGFITVEDKCGHITIPNSFTPNSDGINDFYLIAFDSIGCVSEFELLLFNRWGEVIFESNDPSAKWDGTYNNKIVTDGVFMCLVKVSYNDSAMVYEYSNHVTVLK
ncbi:MAG: gliding motility-associated C-terminal domain-containing protein [Flavobacteriia bacterium]|nr:gliding motility-associated C-terminal domain-containing protein [Flavobacteriia bacterium]